MRRGLAALLVVGLSTGPLPGQDKPPTFPSAVDLVTVDVVVADKDGNPVTGLGPGDFTVLDDGKPQPITSFDAVTGLSEAPEAEAPPGNPRVSTNAAPPARATRTTVIVFDQPHLTSVTAGRSRRALEIFLRGAVLEGERARLVAVGGAAVEGTRDRLLEELPRLEGRYFPDQSVQALSDQEAMRIEMFNDEPLLLRVVTRMEEQLSGRHNWDREAERISVLDRTPQSLGVKVEPGEVRLLAKRAYHDAVARNQATLTALEAAIEELAVVRGRKTVVLVSEGMIKDPQLDGYSRVVAAARRANAALYFIDARELETMPTGSAREVTMVLSIDQGAALADQVASSAGSESLAADTGGFTVKNRNDIAGGHRRIATETRNYYLLGYSPPPGPADGRFRRIEVKVKRKDAVIRARSGYYPGETASPRPARAEPRAGDAPADVAAALGADRDLPGIPLRASSYVFDESGRGKIRAVVALEADLRDVAFEEKDGRVAGSLDFLVSLTPEGGGEPAHFGELVELSLTPERRQALARDWLPLVRGFDLAPGVYRARLLVRDRQGGLIGTVTHRFEVPAARFRTSSPVLSDALEPATSAEKSPPTMGARRTFRERATLYFHFEVYGAGRDPATGRPRVSSGWSIRDAEGEERASAAPAWLPAPGGVPERLGEVNLTFAPGDYELVVDVKDDVTGRTLEVHEPFAVEPAGS